MAKKINSHPEPKSAEGRSRPKTVKHRNATTTPEMRQFIQQSEYSVSQLAKILNISEATIRKWRKRDSVNNTPNTPHKLNTTLSPMQEYVVVGLRYQLKMPLDRLLSITQKFINPNVSRSGLARCLKRHGVSKLDDVDSAFVPERYFNQLPITQGTDVVTYAVNPQTLADTLSFPSVDHVVQVESLSIPKQYSPKQASSVLLGVDADTDWVYLDIYQDSHTQASNRYMAYVLKHGPFHLRKLLVRNYHTFLARFPGASQSAATPKASKAAAPQQQITDSQLSSGDSYEPIQ
ncbi:transcriptional regulator [Shewanella saliphila]|uniref:Transcriptional regulator of eicosapentaenoic acid synthesis PfaR n=1 Tax=Shewanella saliphila TaxID=2282698 RepID=A0ABQ2Q9E7_9GAMM|nr:transcriptional regulator [Shewanella saliphila]MCL1099746.1 transcriptional regulator [Shewanella saliphila]GGP62849.1 transcriptional regulator of eicosapentaenoic acid synthesis PfaR [Shewanella saliphila]